MFAPDEPGLVLSSPAVAELRSDHFNAKRWVSRALAEGKALGTSRGTSSAPSPTQQQHADPASAGRSPVEPGSANRRLPGRNFPAPNSDEGVAQQLVTLLGVRKQAAAESLEDAITGALRYLPRATEDITRLGAETQHMRAKLADVCEAATGVRDSSTVSDKLKDLHGVRERLVRCRTVLNDAQLLSSRVGSVEAAIHDLPAATAGGSSAAGGSRSSAAATTADDLDDFNRVADDIASMRSALQTLQTIDPNYGASVRIQVDRFEAAMQRALESRCLDALKHEDRAVAPQLLAALGKIGRDQNTLKTHSAALVQSRVGKFNSDVLPTAALSSSSSSSSEKVVSALRRYGHSVVKVLAKDRAYFLDVLPRSSNNHNAAENNAGETSVATAGNLSTMSHDADASGMLSSGSSAAARKTTGPAAFRTYLADVAGAIGNGIPSLVASSTNDGFIAIADAVLTELLAPVLATLAPASDDAAEPLPVSRAAIATMLAAPLFQHAGRSFQTQEVAAVAKCSAEFSKPSDYGALGAALHASATRVAKLLRTMLSDGFVVKAVRPQGSPADDVTAALLKALRDAWDHEVVAFADRILQSLPTAASSPSSSSSASGSSSGSMRAQLEAALVSHGQCAELPHHAEHIRGELAMVLQGLAEALGAEVVADGTSLYRLLHSREQLLARGVAAAQVVPAECRAKVLALVLHPAQRFMPTAESVAASGATSGGGESEKARDLGEWVMELPMSLDSAGVSNDVQEWVVACVAKLLEQFAAAARKSIESGRLGKEAAATLLADLEHLESVVAAIDETPENTQVFRDLRRQVVVASSAEEQQPQANAAGEAAAATTTPTAAKAPTTAVGGGKPPVAPRKKD